MFKSSFHHNFLSIGKNLKIADDLPSDFVVSSSVISVVGSSEVTVAASSLEFINLSKIFEFLQIDWGNRRIHS